MMHLAFVLPLFIVIGIFAGFLTMLYGLGGGIILVPFIYFYLKYVGFDPTVSMKVAVGTSLLNVFVATMLATKRHHKAKNIVWPVALRLTPFIILGTLIGLVLSHHFAGNLLRDIFIVFLIFVIINSFVNKSFKASHGEADFKNPRYIQVVPMGLVVGILSVLVGIGGGTIVIPFLRHFKMTMLKASATSAYLAAVIAFCGTIGYIYLGLLSKGLVLPPYTIGFINVVIFVGLQLGTFAGLRLGAKVSDKMTDQSRAKWFPILLILMVLLMLA